MKTQFKIFTFIALVAIMSSCYHPFYTIVGSGPIVTQEFTVESFHSVSGETVINIHIVQGNTQSVIAEGHENMMNFLELRVINGRLSVDLRNGNYSNFQLKVYITVPELESVEVESTGNITVEEFTPMNSFSLTGNSTGNLTCNGNFKMDNTLTIRSTSTGNITIKADAREVDVTQSSTGNVNISGSCIEQQIDISSTGNYNAYNLLSEECTVITTSTGDAHVYVTEFLDATIRSTGSIFYKGNPRVTINDTSVGNLIHVE